MSGMGVEINRSGPPVHYRNVIVASGSSLSSAIEFTGDIAGALPVGIQTPSAIDSATSITFQVAYDGGSSATFANLYDSSGTEYTLTVSTSRSIILTPADFYGVRQLKIRLGTSGSPTTATADRTLILSLRQ